VEQAGDTYFIATPLHCAVGTIPTEREKSS